MKRDDKGLIEGLEYKFLPNGLVDWESMVNNSHVVLFKDKKALIEKKYGNFAETQAKVQSGELEIENKFKLVLLQGWRELANIRGYSGYEYSFFNTSENYASVACKIYWLGNYETDFSPTFSVDGADAHKGNTSDFARSFLTTMACNRAFARAVRSYLNISILGADEVSDKSSPSDNQEEVSGVPNPNDTLARFALNAGIKDFSAFKAYLRKMIEKGCDIIDKKDFPKWKEYNSYDDIPKRTCIALIGKLRDLKDDRD